MRLPFERSMHVYVLVRTHQRAVLKYSQEPFGLQVPAIPPFLIHLCLSLAFLVESSVLHWHLHGRGPVDTQCHRILVALALATAAVALAQAFRDGPKVLILRSFLMVEQGVWLTAIGFILYR